VGHSNLKGWQVADAEHVARSTGTTRFVSAQNQYSLLSREVEREVLLAAKAYGIGVLPYFPLANGLLTGKYAGGARPDGSRLVVTKPHLLDTAPWAALDRFGAFCRERGVDEIDVAFSWLLSRPEVTSVIAGATRPEQVRRNAQAWSWTPTAEDLAKLDEIFPA
jgi:aryl-alcohol dehydrogenase-like predicted oxidoreductase